MKFEEKTIYIMPIYGLSAQKIDSILQILYKMKIEWKSTIVDGNILVACDALALLIGISSTNSLNYWQKDYKTPQYDFAAIVNGITRGVDVTYTFKELDFNYLTISIDDIHIPVLN